MSRKRTLAFGSSAPRNKVKGRSGTHRKAVPAAVIVKLAKAGLPPRKIAKKLGDDLSHVLEVLQAHPRDQESE